MDFSCLFFKSILVIFLSDSTAPGAGVKGQRQAKHELVQKTGWFSWSMKAACARSGERWEMCLGR